MDKVINIKPEYTTTRPTVKERILEHWRKANSQEELCALVGISVKMMRMEISAMRKMGLPLPTLKQRFGKPAQPTTWTPRIGQLIECGLRYGVFTQNEPAGELPNKER